MRGGSVSMRGPWAILLALFLAVVAVVPSGSATERTPEPVVIARGEIAAGTFVSVGPLHVASGDGLPVPPVDETVEAGGFTFDAAPYAGWTMWTVTQNPTGAPFDLYALFEGADGPEEDDCQGVVVDVVTSGEPSVGLGEDIEPCLVPAGATEGRIAAAFGVTLDVTVYGVPRLVAPPTEREPFAVVDVPLGVGTQPLGLDGHGVYVPGDAASPRPDAFRLTSVTSATGGLPFDLFAVFEDETGFDMETCDPDGAELDCVAPAGTVNVRVGAHVGVGLRVSLFADDL